MKKNILSFAAIMMMALASPLFTSCGDDDDEQQTVNTTTTVKEVDYYITVAPTEGMLKYADLQLSYTDDQGADRYADVDSVECNVRVSLTKFPVNGTLKYTCKPKADVAPADSDLIAVRTQFSFYKVTTYSDGTSTTLPGFTTNNKFSILGSKLNAWFVKNETIASYPITLDKDGK